MIDASIATCQTPLAADSWSGLTSAGIKAAEAGWKRASKTPKAAAITNKAAMEL